MKDDFGLSEMNHQKFLLLSKFQRASINIPYFYYRRNAGINVELNFSLFLVARTKSLSLLATLSFLVVRNIY